MLDINLLNPYIRVAMYSVLSPGITIKQRIIYDYELIYIEDGELTFYYDGKPYTFGAGQFIFIRPGIRHSFEDINVSLSQPHVHFDMTYSRTSKKTPVSFKDRDVMTEDEQSLISEDLFFEYPIIPEVFFDDTEQAKKLLFEVIDNFSSGNILYAKGALTELISLLIKCNFHEIAHNEKTGGVTALVKDFIDSSDGENITLDTIASQFSYSKFYLEKKFKEEYGTSIITYKNKVRLESAKAMLKGASVSDVAEKLGFSSIYSFSRAFKNAVGVSPSAYKLM